MTLRAIRILKEVDVVLCEDTRQTHKLLSHYEISKPTKSFHAQSKISKIDDIVEMLREGKNLALVTDAGTPAISDPGSFLIAKVKDELPDVKIIPIPGASALTAAFSASGITGGEFTFLGFLPHKKGRETLFKEIAEGERAYIFYESPHRILKALESLKKFCPDKKVTIARELTKIFEEFVTGTPNEVAEYFEINKDKVRGEFVVMISG